MAGIRLKRMDRKTTISREAVRKIVKEVFAEDKAGDSKKQSSSGIDNNKLAKAS